MRRARSSSVLALIGAVLVACPPARAAVVWEVTRSGDSDYRCPSTDQCTLRGAISLADNEDAIVFSPALGTPIVIELQEPLVVDKDLEIQGPGSEQLAIRPAGPFRPLIIRAGASGEARVMLSDLTIRDGTVLGEPGVDASAPGAHGSSGSDALGGCLLVGGNPDYASATLVRVALRNCLAVGGDGGHGAAGLDVDRGAGGTGGDGGNGGDASGAAIAVLGNKSLVLVQSSVSESFAIAGRGGNGGRGGSGSLTGGGGGNGGAAGVAAGAGTYAESALVPSDVQVQNSSFLANGLVGGDGGAGGPGGRGGNLGASGGAGEDATAGDLTGGNLSLAGSASLSLVHATLGPVGLERGHPGNWDGVSDSDRGTVRGEAVSASTWRVGASVLVGTSTHGLCDGAAPESWSGSSTSAASDALCLEDESMHAGVGDFVDGMLPAVEHGRAVATPARLSRLIDDLDGCAFAQDQSDRPRPLDGDGDGLARCDIGAVEVEFIEDIFVDGFEG